MAYDFPCRHNPVGGAFGFGTVIGSPVGDASISSNFGDLRGVTYHTGLDLAAPLGTPITCIKAGIVRESASEPALKGNYIVIDHGDDDLSWYYHMEAISIFAVGSDVNAGDVLGTVGMTGLTSGPHLHWGCSKVGGLSADMLLGWKNPLANVELPPLTSYMIGVQVLAGGNYVNEGLAVDGRTRKVSIYVQPPAYPGPASI